MNDLFMFKCFKCGAKNLLIKTIVPVPIKPRRILTQTINCPECLFHGKIFINHMKFDETEFDYPYLYFKCNTYFYFKGDIR